MRLKSLHFAEHPGGPQEWTLEGLSLDSKTLIVGRNSTGKSRTLNIISALSRIMSGPQPLAQSGHYQCHFEHNGGAYDYELKYENSQVSLEKLQINGRLVLERGEGGVGKILAEQLSNGDFLDFQTPTSDLAVVTRRDAIQHKFLEPLHQWATSVRHYYFGSPLGKDSFAVFHTQAGPVDDRDANAVVGIFRNAVREFPETFVKLLLSDLARIDYDVETIGLAPPVSLRLENVPTLMGLFVKERNLPGVTDQISMSQGMFRVLSLLIHVNYFQLRNAATCVLIDDIGEGLDFDRSCRLIELLREKADSSDLQLVMSTNDRFVMNSVPLEEWSVLQRKRNHVTVKNYENSRDIFEEFKFTGLSNFSFLELDVINEPHSNEGEQRA